MSEIKLAPSILAADFAALGSEVEAVTEGGADWIHVDVMDGHFVPNLTIGPSVVAAVGRHTHLPLDVHLMIEPVDPYIEQFAEAGADCITVHAEACRHLDRTIQTIKSHGIRAGVALNPATPPEALRWVAEDIDLVLVMTVNPGFGGQSFLTKVVDKIAQIAAMTGPDIHIEVDGGITPETTPDVVAAGATALVAGSAVFRGDDYAANMTAIRQAAATAHTRP